MSDAPRHISVLQNTVLSVLSPLPGETVLDVTVGLGGHAKSFAQAISSSGSLIALDADTKNLEVASSVLKDSQCSVRLIHANFRSVLTLDLPKVDILFADLGLSSPHVDDPSRGFTFKVDAPLDLRFDTTSGPTAAQWIAQSSEQTIVLAFKEYGELPRSRVLAKEMQATSVATTGQVVAIVERVFGYKARSFLPQVFQALRIAVNDELNALSSLLEAIPSLLSSNGRAGFLTYHSLEDRLVKRKFKALTTAEKDPRTGADAVPAPFILLTRKSIVPSEEEVRENPRSRSARLRAIRRNTN